MLGWVLGETFQLSHHVLACALLAVCVSLKNPMPPLGSSHSLRNPGSVRVWLHGLPRASVPGPDRVSPGRRSGGGQRLSLDHHVQGPAGGLHVGEWLRVPECYCLHSLIDGGLIIVINARSIYIST